MYYTLNLKNKTMKLSFTLLSILVVLSVLVPFFIFVFKGLNSKTKTKHKAEKLLLSNGLKYTMSETWNNKFMAFAENQNMLSYVHFKDEINVVKTIDLSQVKSCEIISDYQKGKDKASHLKHLDLKLQFVSSKKEALILSFFDADEAFIEDYEAKRIQNWHDIIETNLSKAITLKQAS